MDLKHVFDDKELSFGNLLVGEHLQRVHELESESYPEDEAASLENLKYRLENAGDLFCGVFWKEKLVGFCCGTRSNSSKLTHESMYNHEPSGSLICIHSVVVDKNLRRRKIGLNLLKNYVKHCSSLAGNGTEKKSYSLALICKQHLIPFYKMGGFELIGKSDVVHGKDTWFEMRQIV